MSLSKFLAHLIVTLMLVSSCSSAPRPDVILHEGPEGGVYLERLADRNVQAAHPIKLDQLLVMRVLGGIQVGNPKTTVQTFFASNSKPERVFSEAELAFLAPLISAALLQATPEQQVRFRIATRISPISSMPGGGAGIGSSAPTIATPQTEVTAGTLYAHGLSLHVTLSEYRHRAVKPDTISGPNRYYPDTTGLKDREVQFTPESALRSDSYKQSDGASLVIDYDSLSKRPFSNVAATTPALPAPSPLVSTPTLKDISVEAEELLSLPAPVSSEAAKSNRKPAAQSDEAQMLKDLVIRKDLELETMKKELRTLRRQLDERDVQLDALKKKAKPATKSPPALP